MNHAGHLRKLISTLRQPPPSKAGSAPGYMSMEIPDELLSPNERTEGRRILSIGGQHFAAFQHSLQELIADRRTEHLSQKEVAEALWRLSCEVLRDPAHFSNRNATQGRIATFVAASCLPLQDHEVIVPIVDLEVDAHVVPLRDAVLVRCNRSILGVSACVRFHPSELKLFLGRTVMMLSESGTGAAPVAKRARHRAAEYLDMLRAYLPASLIVSHSELQFSLDRATLVRESFRLHRARVYYTNEDRPWTLRWHDQLEPSLQRLNVDFVAMQRLPESFRADIDRALHWLGVAEAEHDVDRKLMFACTALEALLTVESDRRKGEAIARRLALLYSEAKRPMVHPGLVVFRYVLRSTVVHGSGLRQAEIEDYRSLRSSALEIIALLLDLERRRGSQERIALLRGLESPASLRAVAEWMDLFSDHAHSRDLAQDIRLSLLKRGSPAVRALRFLRRIWP